MFFDLASKSKLWFGIMEFLADSNWLLINVFGEIMFICGITAHNYTLWLKVCSGLGKYIG